MIRHSEGHSSSVRTKRKVGAKSYQSKKSVWNFGKLPETLLPVGSLAFGRKKSPK